MVIFHILDLRKKILQIIDWRQTPMRDNQIGILRVF